MYARLIFCVIRINVFPWLCRSRLCRSWLWPRSWLCGGVLITWRLFLCWNVWNCPYIYKCFAIDELCRLEWPDAFCIKSFTCKFGKRQTLAERIFFRLLWGIHHKCTQKSETMHVLRNWNKTATFWVKLLRTKLQTKIFGEFLTSHSSSCGLLKRRCSAILDVTFRWS